MKKLALLLALIMAVAMLPVVASGEDYVTMTYYNADGTNNSWLENPVGRAITDATGVALDISYPVASTGDGAQDVAMMIAEGEYPDFIYAKGSATDLYEAGAFIDMRPLIEEYGPNIKKMYGDEFEKLAWSQEDNGIYQLCAYGVRGQVLTTGGSVQIHDRRLRRGQVAEHRRIHAGRRDHQGLFAIGGDGEIPQIGKALVELRQALQIPRHHLRGHRRAFGKGGIRELEGPGLSILADFITLRQQGLDGQVVPHAEQRLRHSVNRGVPAIVILVRIQAGIGKALRQLQPFGARCFG